MATRSSSSTDGRLLRPPSTAGTQGIVEEEVVMMADSTNLTHCYPPVSGLGELP